MRNQALDFLDEYTANRTKMKPNTLRNLEAAKARLIEFFTRDRDIRGITACDADDWLLWLKDRYASGTVGRTVKRAKQFFRGAVRKKLIPENPFADLNAPSQVNRKRLYFVTRDEAHKVLDACPDAEWRLIFALSRFGGLRCPSEHLHLEWTDVNWEKNRFRVHSPKTEHLDGEGDRWVPIFPELRPYLEQAFELAEPGATHVITRYRDTNTNLRTRLLRIIKRAGLTPWPKLFQNLRASRETELAREYPIHFVCAWISNTEMIAAKHYLKVSDDDFDRAAGGAAKPGAAARRGLSCRVPRNDGSPAFAGLSASWCGTLRSGARCRDTPKGRKQEPRGQLPNHLLPRTYGRGVFSPNSIFCQKSDTDSDTPLSRSFVQPANPCLAAGFSGVRGPPARQKADYRDAGWKSTPAMAARSIRDQQPPLVPRMVAAEPDAPLICRSRLNGVDRGRTRRHLPGQNPVSLW